MTTITTTTTYRYVIEGDLDANDIEEGWKTLIEMTEQLHQRYTSVHPSPGLRLVVEQVRSTK